MKIKTAELQGIALDWAVAKCVGVHHESFIAAQSFKEHAYQYSTGWAQGGPIIEREGICIEQRFSVMEGSFAQPIGWRARRYSKNGSINPPFFNGETALIAAMRCYVASKSGDVVDVPNELMED